MDFNGQMPLESLGVENALKLGNEQNLAPIQGEEILKEFFGILATQIRTELAIRFSLVDVVNSKIRLSTLNAVEAQKAMYAVSDFITWLQVELKTNFILIPRFKLNADGKIIEVTGDTQMSEQTFTKTLSAEQLQALTVQLVEKGLSPDKGTLPKHDGVLLDYAVTKNEDGTATVLFEVTHNTWHFPLETIEGEVQKYIDAA